MTEEMPEEPTHPRWTDAGLDPRRVETPQITYQSKVTGPVRRAQLTRDGVCLLTVWTDGTNAGMAKLLHDPADRAERVARRDAAVHARRVQGQAYRRGEDPQVVLDPALYAPEYELGQIQEAERPSSPWLE
ncbi:hypothetical protein [Streptomyces albus]|uniref:hypothetical protein n=1 Tax=Streptomyces albus TaxID=1888 RepID=UPI0004CBE172|nr:hypothetical protein [Streptomyces albus]